MIQHIKKLFKERTGIIAIAICSIIALSIINNSNFWRKQNVIIHDITFYYSYLPATFIYDDVTLVNPNEKFNKYQDKRFYINRLENGNYLIKTSMGMSILYSPFFFIAHVCAKVFDQPQSGFSAPYNLLLQLSSVFYVMLGLAFLRKLLLEYFSEKTIFFTIIGIYVCTNLMYYNTLEAPMSHAYSFSLFCIFLYYIHEWYKSGPTLKLAIIIGVLIGIISLVRPTNILIALLFPLYGVLNVIDLKNRLTLFFSTKIGLTLIIISLVVIVWIPQFLYWKYVTGHFFYFSYGNERFFWNDPKIIEGLFGYKKGLFVYTPIMFIAMFGFLFFKHLKSWKWGLIVYLPLNVYVVFCWWCWWYGGGYGARALVESYAVLSLPLAALIHRILKLKSIRYLFAPVFMFLIFLSSFQTAQKKWNNIHYDSMTKEAYWFIFLKAKSPPKKFLEKPNHNNALNGIR